MPYADFNFPSAAAALEGHDICVVGAGAAGILLAIRLTEKKRKVLLIESGNLAPDDEKQALNIIEQTAKPMRDPVWNRKRIVGGTTTAWGGQSLPFSSLDFARRDWVVNSGWPIEYEDVAKYYDSANAFMHVDNWDYGGDLFARFGIERPPIDAQRIDYHFSKWAPKPNFHKLYCRTLKKNVMVLYNAHLVRIDLQPNGRVQSLSIANFVGRTHRISVGEVILATGGIETNRLLLLNDHQLEGGLGNHSGWLGRAFMDHPSLVGGTIIPKDARQFQALFGTRIYRRKRYSARLSAPAAWQRENKLLNVSASFLFLYPDERSDPFRAIKRLLRGMEAAAVVDILRHLSRLAESAVTVAIHGYLYKPGSCTVFGLNLEQEPCSESYVTLERSRDRFGLRQASLHWVISEKSWRTAVLFAKQIKTELERLNLAGVELTPELQSETSDWEGNFSDVNHHMGGTRMSSVASQGVVTRNMQVWGIPNLSVASCSVFPTSSHSNPTLTLLALCERLVERIANSSPLGDLSKLLD
jgi:choline dehydrogenase-like flavoprotein